MGKAGVKSIYKRFEDLQRAIDEADAQAEKQEDPREVVKAARARMMGKKPSELMLLAMLYHPAGMAIYLSGEKDARVLWHAFDMFDMCEQGYFRRVIGRPRFAATSRMEFMPERLETRADDSPDPRTEEQKIAYTTKAWMQWQGLLGQLPGFQRSAIIRASWQMDELHKGGSLTVHGKSFIAAIRSLADILERS